MENDDYYDKLDNFKQDENTFSQIIHSQNYKKINDIRTQLLMKIDKEVSKYLKNKTMINSITSLNYLKYIFPNMTINLKSQHITSSNENEISFSYIFSKCKSDETKINHFESFPFLFNYHHYRQFKKKKKLIIAKNSCNNAKLDSNTCLLSPITVLSVKSQVLISDLSLFIILKSIIAPVEPLKLVLFNIVPSAIGFIK